MNHHEDEHQYSARIPNWSDLPVSNRRRFLQVMGASMALASSGCMPQPKETIVPYVRSPEYFVPGRPSFFATSMTLGGYATGVLVESHTGRPTKIEGNPDHPSSLGAVDAFSQAAVLGLYDPDRSQAISQRGEVQTWQTFSAAIATALEIQQSKRGAGLRILSETITSPTLSAQLENLLAQYPEARWYSYEPVNQDNADEGATLAFGAPLEPLYHFDQVDVVLAIEADFLAIGPGSLAYSRQFMSGRDPLLWDPVAVDGGETRQPTRTAPNRLYAIEAAPSCTGTVADHRLPLRPSETEAAVHYLAQRIIQRNENRVNTGLSPAIRQWLDVVADELLAAGQRSVVVGGSALSVPSQALVHGMNVTLGNTGTAVEYMPPIRSQPGQQIKSLQRLVQEMNDGQVDMLVMLGGNPVFNAPSDFQFRQRLKKVPLSVHVSLYEDETSQECEWHIPAAHELESWGDARSHDGTASIIQPLIAPLYEGKTMHEVVGLLLGTSETSSYEVVREFWRIEWGEQEFEARWHQALHDGLIADSRPPADAAESAAAELVPQFDDLLRDPPMPRGGESIEICLRPDPTIYDGRFANNGWLQELPKPITKLTWDNAAIMSRATADRLKVGTEDVVRIRTPAGELELPAWIVPGHADNCITAHLGYGRAHGGTVAEGTGSNTYKIRTSRQLWSIPDADVEKAGRQYKLACTQLHNRMEHTDPARWMTLAKYQSTEAQGHGGHDAHGEPADPDTPHHEHEHPNFYDPAARPPDDSEYAWAMSVNLTTCIGCSACVIACQSENNIPVVGKEMVQRNREMHWLRIDTYFDEQDEHNIAVHQPMMCVHCEHAPCELVCPVGATVHSAEGLNEMVYNRCVGTRYCSHNCPYKVRRFNFFNYTDDYPPTLQLLQNPDVTVRMRGVMEKCTYCVQRISKARITAKRENRMIRDGDVITACQGACPTRAIQFGDVRNPHSVVAIQKQHPLDYGVLAELNTRPRTTYLARVTNPTEALPGGTAATPDTTPTRTS